MYQAYAYAREYHCPHVILLFPRFGDVGRKVADYRLHPGDQSSPRIDIATVDITGPIGHVRREVEEIIAGALDR